MWEKLEEGKTGLALSSIPTGFLYTDMADV